MSGDRGGSEEERRLTRIHSSNCDLNRLIRLVERTSGHSRKLGDVGIKKTGISLSLFIIVFILVVLIFSKLDTKLSENIPPITLSTPAYILRKSKHATIP